MIRTRRDSHAGILIQGKLTVRITAARRLAIHFSHVQILIKVHWLLWNFLKRIPFISHAFFPISPSSKLQILLTWFPFQGSSDRSSAFTPSLCYACSIFKSSTGRPEHWMKTVAQTAFEKPSHSTSIQLGIYNFNYSARSLPLSG